MDLGRWRWKVSEFDAVQVTAGGEIPIGCVKADGPFDKEIIAYVTVDHLPIPIRDGDWLVFEHGSVRRVVSDKRFRELAARCESCGS